MRRSTRSQLSSGTLYQPLATPLIGLIPFGLINTARSQARDRFRLQRRWFGRRPHDRCNVRAAVAATFAGAWRPFAAHPRSQSVEPRRS
jgi:hypothetical protein